MKIIFSVVFFIATVARCQTISDYMRFTERFEGKRHIVYNDKMGNKTIGIGHKLTKSENFFIISESKIQELFQKDILTALNAAKKHIKNFDSMPHAAKLIAVDLAYNCGETGFSKFKKAISAFNTHDFVQAGEELRNSKWYCQVGNRAKHHELVLSGI